MTSMFVPEPVMSLAITPKKSKKGGGSDTADKFSKVKTLTASPSRVPNARGSKCVLLLDDGCFVSLAGVSVS